MFFFRVVVLSLEFKTRDEVGLCSRQIDYKNRYAKKEKKKAGEMFVDAKTAVREILAMFQDSVCRI